VSPQNILVGADGLTRVVDFGVAKADGRLQTTTDATAQKGKLAYMAPERLAGHDADRSDDLWSMAVVFWEMLTGRRLFDAPHTAMLVTKLLHDPITAPSEFGVPGAYDTFFERALSRDRSARFQSAPEMTAAIDAVGGSTAPPHTVADWLKGEASEQLGERARLVAGMDAALSPRTTTATIGGSSSFVANHESASAATTPGLARAVPSVESSPGGRPQGENRTQATTRRVLRGGSLLLLALAASGGIGMAVFRLPRSRSASGDAPPNVAPAASVGLDPSLMPTVASTDVDASARPSASTTASDAIVDGARPSAAATTSRPSQRGAARLTRPPQSSSSPVPPPPSDPMRLDSRR
jgi:serine/threonine-protein kinase